MMNINLTTGQPADFGMPMSGRGRVASLRALPMSTGVVSAAAAGSKRDFVDVIPVCGYRHVTGVAVAKAAFPGTSAWRPPN